MVVYVARRFRRWMRDQGLKDGDLCRAVREMTQGLIDANLGGALFKKRITRNGQGKRGGFRTIVAKPEFETWLFVYGFAKSDLGNISAAKELFRPRRQRALRAAGLRR
ncbi:type II toxin-antitoxin system RelE/ParE family toxin [Roseateles chitinivorans]|uniref:type II toxin-antitoxin system RelE/ParE family toxin n=1 Tax=Roseateles chitinivorans TaxID=2917965 RepID=UPI003D67B687